MDNSFLPVVAGIDVGGPKKGFHAVALQERRIVATCATLDPGKAAAWCRHVAAAAVGIDAPCCWSRTGRARPCECALAAAGITTFATPSLTVGQRHPFSSWMLNGAALFRLPSPDYQLFAGHAPPAGPVCFETFPHAVACVLAKSTLSAAQKRIDRPALLREAGYSLDSLRTIDLVDAALCARRPTAAGGKSQDLR